MKKFYSSQRPIDIGGYPKIEGNPVKMIKNFPGRVEVDDFGKRVWGWIEYEDDVDVELMKGYGLDPQGMKWWQEVQFKVDKDGMVISSRFARSEFSLEPPETMEHTLKNGVKVMNRWYTPDELEKKMDELGIG